MPVDSEYVWCVRDCIWQDWHTNRKGYARVLHTSHCIWIFAQREHTCIQRSPVVLIPQMHTCMLTMVCEHLFAPFKQFKYCLLPFIPQLYSTGLQVLVHHYCVIIFGRNCCNWVLDVVPLLHSSCNAIFVCSLPLLHCLVWRQVSNRMASV